METAQLLTTIGGLLIGTAFGAIVQRTDYCMMGAVADFALTRDLGRMRAWMLAIAVALVATQGLSLSGLIDLAPTQYRAAQLPIGGLIVGGLLFGFGMVIACGCSSRSLVNAGSGDLRALITVVMIGIASYATLHGVLAQARVWFVERTSLDLSNADVSDTGIGTLLASVSGLSSTAADALSALVVAIALAAFALRDASFRRQRQYLFASVSLGLLIGAGWYVTGVLGYDEFEPQPLVSLRFVATVGDSLQYLMLFSGVALSFGVATVIGVLVGAFAAALSAGRFELRAFEDLHDLRRYLAGGVLMGVGGVLSLGCTVGQGLTGVSTLAVGSVIATAAIVLGGIVGVRYLEQGSLVGALRAAAGRV